MTKSIKTVGPGEYALTRTWEKRPKFYTLGGFTSKDEVLDRAKNLLPLDPKHPPQLCVRTDALGWGLCITDKHISGLTPNENSPGCRLVRRPPITDKIAFLPQMYRGLKRKYVEDFFKDGKLMISSFAKFHEHKDEGRKDSNEGKNKIIGFAKNGNVSESETICGQNAFVLCASMSRQGAMLEGNDSCIVVERPTEFIECIKDALFEQGLDVTTIIPGPCVYSEDTSIQRTTPDLRPMHEGFSLEDIFDHANSAGGLDIFFSKDISYVEQQEYRILWFIDAPKVEKVIHLKVPNAVQYCRPIYPKE